MEEVHTWQNRPLQAFYPFVFVDSCTSHCVGSGVRHRQQCMSSSPMMQTGAETRLGFGSTKRKASHAWMQIFDELKVRGVEAIGFLSMDGVTGLEEGARAIFPLVVV